jgi:hypothetical protein
MRADEKNIERTAGDTVPILLQLRRVTDQGTVAVSDTAQAIMRVRVAGQVVEITGTPRGDGSGVFMFEPGELPETEQSLPYAVEVVESGKLATYAKGELVLAGKFARGTPARCR